MRVLDLVALAVVACSVSVRVVEAGDVIVTAKSGKLALKGSIDADVVTVHLSAPGVMQVAPGVATTVNGAATPVSFTVTGGVTADLGAGDDVLAFDELSVTGDVKIKMGAGFDTFTMRDTDVGGVTKLDLGDGASSVSLCQSVTAKGLTLTGGAAGSGVANAGCVGVENGEVSTTDGLAVVFGDTTIHGNLSVKSKLGAVTFVAANSGADGKGIFKFGTGTALLGLCDAGIGENLTVTMSHGNVNGTLACTIGEKTGNVTAPHGVVVLGAQIGGSFALMSSSEGDALSMVDSTVGQKMKLTLGEGINLVAVGSSVVGESLAVKAGNDADVLVMDNTNVGGDATFAYGDGGNVVLLGDTSVGGDLAITTEDDDDTITTDTVTVVGKKTIKHGGGTDTVQ